MLVTGVHEVGGVGGVGVCADHTHAHTSMHAIISMQRVSSSFNISYDGSISLQVTTLKVRDRVVARDSRPETLKTMQKALEYLSYAGMRVDSFPCLLDPCFEGMIMSILDDKNVLIKPISGDSHQVNLSLVKICQDDIFLASETTRQREHDKMFQAERENVLQSIASCEDVIFSAGRGEDDQNSAESSEMLSSLIELAKTLGTVDAAIRLAQNIIRHPHDFKISHIQALCNAEEYDDGGGGISREEFNAPSQGIATDLEEKHFTDLEELHFTDLCNSSWNCRWQSGETDPIRVCDGKWLTFGTEYSLQNTPPHNTT